MLLKPRIINFLTTGIIAPHGMTDWIHALQTQNVEALLKINAVSTGSFLIMHQTGHERILNILFYLFSTLHFQHDMPFKISSLRYFAVQLLFLSSGLDLDLLYFFMILIHVPHHYMINWKYISKTPLKSFLILAFSTFFMVNAEKFNLNNTDFMQPIYYDALKGIVVSHIIYQELFIHTDISRHLLKFLAYSIENE